MPSRRVGLDNDKLGSVNPRKLFLGVSIVALFAVIAVFVALGANNRRRPVPAPSPGASLIATIRQSAVRDVAAGFGSIWVANGESRTVTRIDPATDAIVAVIAVPDPASVLAVDTASIWLTSLPGNSVTRIDPGANRVVGSLAPGGLGPIGITVFDGHVWVANHDGEPTGSVAKIDPAKMQIVDLIHVGSAPDSGPTWIAAGAGSLWVGVPNIAAVVRINPTNDTILATIADACVSGEIVANDHAVWTAGVCGPGVTFIDPATNTLTPVRNAHGDATALALEEDSVWYGTGKNVLGRINTTTHTVVAQLRLPGPPFGAIAAFGFVWVTDRDDGLLFKIKPH